MPARIWIIWALFLIRGSFCSVMQPMWEGWDEYAHVAWIQHWNDHGTLPRTTDSVSREIDESMRLAPLPWELNWIGPPYLTHGDWWALPAAERDSRVRQLAQLSPALAHQPAVPINARPFIFYEAQQPPLFYWIASPLMRFAGNWQIHDRVVLIRLFSVLLASIAIPFTFLASRKIYPAALLAVAPGFAIDAAHVANDGLAIGIAAIFLWLMMKEKPNWIAAGTVLGAAILAKASLLVLAPVLVILWFRRPKQTGLALAVGFAIGGWWYARNILIGMPLTGWQESVPPGQIATAAVALFHGGGWINEAYTIAKSFTWFGAWSFLTLRTWMYLALEAVALAGMALSLRKPETRVPLTFTIAFTIAIVGGAAAYFAVHNVAGIPGWYLWPCGGAMAILIASGLRQYSILFAAMLAATDLFGAAARMMPYYAGLAERNHGSILQFSLAATRLHTPMWLAALWIAATIAIPLLMVQRFAKTRM